MNCTEITAGTFKKSDGDGTFIVVKAPPTPDQGDATLIDDISLQFYGSEFDAAYNGDQTGTFDLSMPDDDNYATCSRCLLMYEDPDPDPTNGAARVYFQAGGTLTVDAASDQVHGKVNATLTDVTLVEVTIESGTYVSTPVDGGKCLHIKTATIMVEPPVVPAEWTCDKNLYGDSSCDCGCGAVDIDCAGNASTNCDTNQCPASNKPDNAENWKCVPVPAGWLCGPTYYGDGMCQCGCGVIDEDCTTGQASECTDSTCPTGVDPVDGMNWLCTGVPAAWTCNQGFYGDGDCDCGCGAVDSDCADANVGSCKYCDDLGSCNTAMCPGTINATNNAVCTTP